MLNPIRHITTHYTLVLGLSSSLLTLSSANYAFDNQAFSQTLALEPFIRQFGDCNAKTNKCALDTTWLSLFNSVLYATFSLGLLIGTWIQAKYGRRKTITALCVIPFVSTTIILTSTNRWQLFAGRTIHYLYAGMELGCIPVYQAELVPREVRGFAVGSYQLSYGFGNLFMNIIVKGTSYLHTNASWRIPFGLFYVIPTIVGIGSFFLPESPRWLIQQGRIDDAKAVLKRIRSDSSDAAIDAEIEQVLLVLEALKDQGSWMDLVRGTNLRRTLIVLGATFFNQATGQNFTSSYGAVFIRSVGVINTQTMGIINGVIGVVMLTIAMYTTDRLGRKPIFVTGGIVQAAALFTMAGLGSVNPTTRALGKGIIAMQSMFGVGYSFGSSSVNHVITAEIPHQSLRDKTQRLAGWTNNLFAFTVAFSLPYALNEPGNLHARVGFIYGPMAVLSILFGLFLLPECKGRSLEEVNLLFYHRVPAWGSSAWQPEGGALADLQDMTIHRGNIKGPVDQELAEKGQTEFIEMTEKP